MSTIEAIETKLDMFIKSFDTMDERNRVDHGKMFKSIKDLSIKSAVYGVIYGIALAVVTAIMVSIGSQIVQAIIN